MSELKSFIVLYDGKFIRAYEESEADKVIAELEDKIHQKDFFWEGCAFAKMGFKNTIEVANYVEDLKSTNERLIGESRRLVARHGWHKLSELKPPEDVRVLVFVNILGVTSVHVDMYTRDDGFALKREPRFRAYNSYVTHWMLLPKEP